MAGALQRNPGDEGADGLRRGTIAESQNGESSLPHPLHQWARLFRVSPIVGSTGSIDQLFSLMREFSLLGRCNLWFGVQFGQPHLALLWCPYSAARMEPAPNKTCFRWAAACFALHCLQAERTEGLRLHKVWTATKCSVASPWSQAEPL